MNNETKKLNNANKPFSFSSRAMKQIQDILSKYPKQHNQSALIPVLDIAQRENNNWLSKEAIEHVSEMFKIQPVKVWEVASFYSMFNLEPIGKYHIQLCRTTTCWLCGSDKIKSLCEKYTGTTFGNTSDDNIFTLSYVECLGACINAPVMQINDDYYENLDENKVSNIINKLKNHESK